MSRCHRTSRTAARTRACTTVRRTTHPCRSVSSRSMPVQRHQRWQTDTMRFSDLHVLPPLAEASLTRRRPGRHPRRTLTVSSCCGCCLQTTAGAVGNDSLCAPQPAPPAHTAEEPPNLANLPSFQARVSTRQVSRPTSAHPRMEMRRLQVDKIFSGPESGSQSDRKASLSSRAQPVAEFGSGAYRTWHRNAAGTN